MEEPCGAGETRTGKKKRYARPVVESEQIFETLAALCNKCPSGPKPLGNCWRKYQYS